MEQKNSLKCSDIARSLEIVSPFIFKENGMAEARSWEAGSTERMTFHNLRGSFWVSFIAQEK